MKEDNISTLRFDDDFFVESAENRYDDGDYLGALTLLNKRERMHAPLADAYAAYADVYEALELWQLAIDCWYRFLDTCNEADFSEGYEGLAVCYARLGDEFRSNTYYRRAYLEVGGTEEEIADYLAKPPKLHLVEDEEDNAETVAAGLARLKMGDLTGAKEVFSEIEAGTPCYAAAAGLSAMCTLMMGDEEGAEKEVSALLSEYPEDVQVLTTYCAVLGAREKPDEAREVAKKLSELPVHGTDDLYRVATALCETGLHREAYEKLKLLLDRLPYDDNVLWFYAVAANRVGENEQAIEALEMLTTVYPRKAVARYYLEALRLARDGGESVTLQYFYRLPEQEYSRVAAFLLQINKDTEAGEDICATSDFADAFHLAFDEMEGRDAKLQLLAAKVAEKYRADPLLREILLDYQGDEMVKLSVLHDLICRNEENSFGVVICELYKEVFLHELRIGRRRQEDFLDAFADVYARFSILGDRYENRICGAAEDLYSSLAEAGAWEYFSERAALASAIYREARLEDGETSLDDICKLFEADRRMTERILNFMM